MRIACEMYGIPFIDLFKTSGVNPINYLAYYDDPDNIHPNGANGMRKMGEIIAGALLQIHP